MSNDRLHYQLRDLTVCNEDLRHTTDPRRRDFIKRLRRLRHEGMYSLDQCGAAAPVDYGDADWAAHRLALVVGVDAPLGRDDLDAGIDPNDVRTLLAWMRWQQEGRWPHIYGYDPTTHAATRDESAEARGGETP